MCRALLLSLLFTAFVITAKGQSLYDSAYVESYADHITSRYFFSQKRSSIILRRMGDFGSMRYVPNTTFNMGVGATYQWLTLNIGIGFKFLNPKRDQRGTTRYWDLQSHIYGNRWAVDLYGQFYRGFFLKPTYVTSGAVKYYHRPDIRLRQMGTSVQYVFNNKRFSYRAAMLQSEWQKRLAGSLLLGGEFYFGDIRADSSLIPPAIYPTPDMQGRNVLSYMQVGPNVGYAYTYVYQKHFYVMGSVTMGVNYGYNVFKTNTLNSQRDGFTFTNTFRFSAGYNSERIAINFLYTSNVANLASESLNRKVAVNTNNYRLVFTYRFAPGPKLNSRLRHIEPDRLKDLF